MYVKTKISWASPFLLQMFHLCSLSAFNWGKNFQDFSLTKSWKTWLTVTTQWTNPPIFLSWTVLRELTVEQQFTNRIRWAFQWRFSIWSKCWRGKIFWIFNAFNYSCNLFFTPIALAWITHEGIMHSYVTNITTKSFVTMLMKYLHTKVFTL